MRRRVPPPRAAGVLHYVRISAGHGTRSFCTWAKKIFALPGRPLGRAGSFASVDAIPLADRLRPVAARVAEFGRRASLRCLCPIMDVLVRVQSRAIL